MDNYSLTPIAHIHNDFPEKFGIPRQSGLVETLQADIIFTSKYQDMAAFRGLQDYSHLWIIWGFSKAMQDDWSATVRPPRLGGNERMGVFATRSPYRPNSLGLSSVRLDGITHTEEGGTVLHVLGADLLNGTPIFDIKPYLTFTDSHPDALDGFAGKHVNDCLRVNCPSHLQQLLPSRQRESLLAILAHDPRPSYQSDEARIYGMKFAEYEIKFTVKERTLTVVSIEPVAYSLP